MGVREAGKTASQLKDELLTEIRNIIHFREDLQAPTNRLDYEEFQKQILSYAGAVFHFRERLAAWLKKKHLATKPTLKEATWGNLSLKVCGDLFNEKKHGGCENTSKLSPHLSGLSMNPQGVVGLRFDGQMKTGDITAALPFRIEIHCSENRSLGDATKYISRTFYRAWVPLMKDAGLLNPSNALEERLLSELEKFKDDDPWDGETATLIQG